MVDVDARRAQDVAEAIGGAASASELDVCDADAVERTVAGVVAEHGRLDLMVNNAGISLGGETHAQPLEHWDRIIDVNIRGVVNGVVAAYPRMVAQGSGRIVNTASGAGLSPAPLTVVYSMTKHAVVGLSLGLRPEAKRHGVGVSVLCPGAVDTPILDSHPPADLPPRDDEPLLARDYMKRVGMKPMPPERFAEAALDGIERGKAVITGDPKVHALWLMQRASPALVERMGGVLIRRVLKG